VRIAGIAAVFIVMAGSCSDDSSDMRSFDLTGEEHHGQGRPEGPTLSEPLTYVEAAVVETPIVVTVGENVDAVVELRNPEIRPIGLHPCPVWSSYFGGESGTSALIAGELPCDDIGEIQPGERIRLKVTVPSPTVVDFSEGGQYSWFTWRFEGEPFMEVYASVAIPMREDG
jgi:hypothetical protein